MLMGGSTWKPQVTPIGPAPVSFNAGGNVQPVTKTSLAAKQQNVPQIGSAHNFAPKPFGGAQQVNGIGDPTVKSIVNKQYNTPVGIYSEETIAETLSAQAEKNEKTYTPGSSEVLKMVQEIDSEPKTPEPVFPFTLGPPEGIRKRLVIPKPRPRKPASPPDTSPRTPVPPSVGLLGLKVLSSKDEEDGELYVVLFYEISLDYRCSTLTTMKQAYVNQYHWTDEF
ncbi:PDZ and LIM domain protein Zasp [Blattella germanica]|nr:PDZ and LIM domain protein Zasp [Blattella germanica]